MPMTNCSPWGGFPWGGATTVRGYRENEIVWDNGYAFSLEWRIPLWEDSSLKGEPKLLQLAPFVDYGAGWNKGEYSQNISLSSVGAGLLWTSQRINAELYFAHGFDDVISKEEHDLQDDGIHFRPVIKIK